MERVIMENHANSIETMLSSEDPCVRRDACETLGAGRCCEYIPHLAARLSDEDFGVRESALNALIAIGGRDVADAVATLRPRAPRCGTWASRYSNSSGRTRSRP